MEPFLQGFLGELVKLAVAPPAPPPPNAVKPGGGSYSASIPTQKLESPKGPSPAKLTGRRAQSAFRITPSSDPKPPKPKSTGRGKGKRLGYVPMGSVGAARQRSENERNYNKLTPAARKASRAKGHATFNKMMPWLSKGWNSRKRYKAMNPALRLIEDFKHGRPAK